MSEVLEEFIVPGSPSASQAITDTWVKNEPVEISDGEDVHNRSQYSQIYGQLEPNVLLSVTGNANKIDTHNVILKEVKKTKNLLQEMQTYFHNDNRGDCIEEQGIKLKSDEMFLESSIGGQVIHSTFPVGLCISMVMTDAERQRHRRALETTEERVRRRMLDAERHRIKRNQESPEDTVRRLSFNAERQRIRRSNETPTEARQRKSNDTHRRHRQRSLESAEEASIRRAIEAERQRMRRRLLTPEEQAKRRAADAQQQRIRRSKLSPEEMSIRRAIEADRRRRQRNLESHEQRLRRRAVEAERQRIKRRDAYLKDFTSHQLLEARLTKTAFTTLEQEHLNKFNFQTDPQAILEQKHDVLISKTLAQNEVGIKMEQPVVGEQTVQHQEDRLTKSYNERQWNTVQRTCPEQVQRTQCEKNVQVVTEESYFADRQSKMDYVHSACGEIGGLSNSLEPTLSIKIENPRHVEDVVGMENHLPA